MLKDKIQSSLTNNYGMENFDQHRFGKYVSDGLMTQFKTKFKKAIKYKSESAETIVNKISNFENKLECIWERVNLESKVLMVELIAFRLLGYKKVKLSINNDAYWNAMNEAKNLKKDGQSINPNFLHFTLQLFNLKPLGIDLELYFVDGGIAIDFIIEQYAYKLNGKTIVEAEKGDTVLDIGGCWGDTALYFANKVEDAGKVYSFEFIPQNIEIFKKNISLNSNLASRITLVEQPVSNVSNDKIYYIDNGPSSKISQSPLPDQTGTALTITIDDFVKQNNINKVDFIKMDIEGAEPKALEGAINTIKRFKPKLAIAIYHSINDFVNIPTWLMNLNLGYQFYIGHYTIHAEETIIFATPKLAANKS